MTSGPKRPTPLRPNRSTPQNGPKGPKLIRPRFVGVPQRAAVFLAGSDHTEVGSRFCLFASNLQVMVQESQPCCLLSLWLYLYGPSIRVMIASPHPGTCIGTVQNFQHMSFETVGCLIGEWAFVTVKMLHSWGWDSIPHLLSHLTNACRSSCSGCAALLVCDCSIQLSANSPCFGGDLVQ